MDMLRKARFMGTWYPAEIEECDKITSPPEIRGNLKAGVLPHAGLFYSGALIKSFFDKLSTNVRRIIILSPSHYFHLPPSVLITAEFTESETPYGNVKTEKLDAEDTIVNNNVIAAEHGVEMFLPFIGRKGNIIVSYGIISALEKPEDAGALSRLLLPLIDGETAIIASSDFTHYGPRFGYTPYRTRQKEMVEEHDRKCAQLLASGKGMEAYRAFRSSTICGIAPAAIVSELAKDLKMEGTTGPYSTSLREGEIPDDFVSYHTVFWREDGKERTR